MDSGILIGQKPSSHKKYLPEHTRFWSKAWLILIFERLCQVLSACVARAGQWCLLACLLMAVSSSLLLAPVADAANSDCHKSRERVERVICQSTILSRQDKKVSLLYKQVMQKLTVDARESLHTEQQTWLAARQQSCDLYGGNAESCLTGLYSRRSKELAQLLAFDNSTDPQSGPLKILRVSPSGENVPAGRQLVIQFDRSVVALGKMARSRDEIPIAITPALACEWRWLNTSALACQLREEDTMQLATRYRVQVKPGITTTSGARLAKTFEHQFTTARPKVTYSRFIHWLSPGTPLIQVTFDQPVTQASVESALSMHARQIPDPQSVAVVAHAETQPRPQAFWQIQKTAQHSGAQETDRVSAVPENKARRVWAIEPVRELPLNQSIWLEVRPGLVSSLGSEPGDEKRSIVKFETFPEFKFLGVRCKLEQTGKIAELSLDDLASNLRHAASLNDTAATQQDLSKKDQRNDGAAGTEPVKKETVKKETEQPAAGIKRCAPLSSTGLVFSAPVKNSVMRDHAVIAPALDGGRKDYDPWENRHDWSRLASAHKKGRTYSLWLPGYLKAWEQYRIAFDPESFTDEFGRTLTGDSTISFFTAHREPNLFLNHPYAVLEKDVDTDIPLYVTNLDSIRVDYQRFTGDKRESGLTQELDIAPIEDVAFAMPMGLRSLIGESTGVIQGRLSPQPAPPGYHRDPEFFMQVSPFQVHVKMGHFSSLVWVTDFANGNAVSNARVSLLKGTYSELVKLAEQGVFSATDTQGLAELPGVATLDPELTTLKSYHNHHDARYFVYIEKDKETALLPLDSAFRLYGSGVYPYPKRRGEHAHAWGTTAQGVYKAGDQVDYKIYVRDQNDQHWVAPAAGKYHLRVQDPQQKTVYEQKDITLNRFGAFAGSFTVPEKGAMGWYRFMLSVAVNPEKTALSKPDKMDNGRQLNWQPLSILVSDFTPSPFKVSTELNGEQFKSGDSVDVSSLAQLFSGGPFTDAEIRLTARLDAKPFVTHNPELNNFQFGSYNTVAENSEDIYRLPEEQKKLLDVRGQLNDRGEHQISFTVPDADIYYGNILVEAAVKDDRGKFVAATRTADYAGRDRFVGLRNTQWLYKKGKRAQLEVVVVNEQGQLIGGADTRVSIRHQEFKVSRVKGAGNAYLNQNIMQWVEQSRCQLASKKRKPVTCQFKPQRSGYYQFIATTRDSLDREHKTVSYGWVTGRDSVVWGQSDDATLSIVPEQQTYKTGETARYLVKNPFPGAKALITVERYGVVDHWVETLDSGTPVIEFEVKENYLPGFYLSVVVMSPRVEKPLSANNVDLGKPSYRMGYIATGVKDSQKELKLRIKPDKKTYKPRETVTVDIQVDRRTAKNTPVEFAVAVVDESVLALNREGTGYYDPYQGFNKLDELDVLNYSLISRLVGRQKFEKKGANPGGDGGTPFSALRNMFKFVSYWNPSLQPDKHGRATVQFDAPDNLTGWKILVMAVTPNDRMGLGLADFKVNKPTELRAVMPNQLLEGDQFNAGFTVMNRTDKTRELTVDLTASGALVTSGADSGTGSAAKSASTTLKQRVKVAPYKRQTVSFPVTAQGVGEIHFLISAGDRSDSDRLEHRVSVNPRTQLQTAANFGVIDEPSTDDLSADGSSINDSTATGVSSSKTVTVEDAVAIPAAIEISHPAHNHAQQADHKTINGELGAILSPTVIGNIDGAFRYIADYPHQCWEQQLTKAVFAARYQTLKPYLHKKVQWSDSEQQITQALNRAASFQAPNGGMAYWQAGNDSVSPYLSAYTALAFNWLRRAGHQVPENVEAPLHDYLEKMLRKNVFPSFYSKGMASSVRAVALAALAPHQRIDRQDIQRYLPHVAQMDLFGRAHFLQAAISTQLSEATVETLVSELLSYANESAGKLQFNETLDDGYKYILATPLRANCAVLTSLMQVQEQKTFASVINGLPEKLARTVTQTRGNRDHWENTQENVFCLTALSEYHQRFENKTLAISAQVLFDNQLIGQTQFKQLTDKPARLTRALTDSDKGRQGTLSITKKGSGRLYYTTRLSYNPALSALERTNAGMDIRREYSVERDGKFVLLSDASSVKAQKTASGKLAPMTVQRGDVVRVDLFLSIPAARHFVVVNDPVPGGLEPVNIDLATASVIDAGKGQFNAAGGSWWFNFSDWQEYGRYFWSFYHKELRHDAARFYADYLPAGNYHLSYTAQAIAEGEFTVMPVSAEEMYDPDIYGQGIPAKLQVR